MSSYRSILLCFFIDPLYLFVSFIYTTLFKINPAYTTLFALPHGTVSLSHNNDLAMYI